MLEQEVEISLQSCLSAGTDTMGLNGIQKRKQYDICEELKNNDNIQQFKYQGLNLQI